MERSRGEAWQGMSIGRTRVQASAGAVKLCIRASVLLQNFGGLAIRAWNLSEPPCPLEAKQVQKSKRNFRGLQDSNLRTLR